MRILQIIDSLEVGGAERMAVNYANALSDRIEFSGLVSTRKEGILKNHIQPNVSYWYLNRKFTLDVAAVFRLRSFCIKEKIDWIHAHGTSYFIAFLLKLTLPQIKIIWHEHAGARSSEKGIRNIVLWICSRFFKGIIVVNHTLEKWCKSVLGFNEVLYLPNFTMNDTTENPVTLLHGTAFKRILCLANLRHPKNHRLLLQVATRFRQTHPDWTFHLVGRDANDDYSNEIKAIIKKSQLEDSVYIYGLREDINHIIEQVNIGVLTSSSEGLPVALLEYGWHKKAVVSTNVGEIPLIISDGVNGFTVPSDAEDLFYDALAALADDASLQEKFGKELHQTILDNHSEKAVMAKYINWINKDLK